MNMLFPDCCQLVSEQPRSSAWAFYTAEWSSFIIMLLTGLTQGTLNDSANTSVWCRYGKNLHRWTQHTLVSSLNVSTGTFTCVKVLPACQESTLHAQSVCVEQGVPHTQAVCRPHLQLPVFLRIEAHWLYGGDDNNHTKGDRHKEHDYMLCSIFQSQFLFFIFQGAFSHWNTQARRFSTGDIVRATAAACSPLLKRNISKCVRCFFSLCSKLVSIISHKAAVGHHSIAGES